MNNLMWIINNWTAGPKKPTKPGYYYIAYFDYHNRLVITTLEWSRHGWNTSEKNPEHAISYDDQPHWWTEAVQIKEAVN